MGVAVQQRQQSQMRVEDEVNRQYKYLLSHPIERRNLRLDN